MTPDIYDAGSHSPAQHYAAAGYAALVAAIPDAAYTGADPYPTDEDDPDWHDACERWTDRRVLAALVGDPPKGGRKRGPKPAAPDPAEKEPMVSLAGHRIGWHRGLPELKIWAGQATLQTICDGRRLALHEAGGIPAGVRLLDWTIPYPTMSGLDPRTSAMALDIGFSPAVLGMPVACYAAAELLMVLGMQLSPITRFGPREYGYTDPAGRWWKFSVVEREGYHRMLTMAQPVRGMTPAGV